MFSKSPVSIEVMEIKNHHSKGRRQQTTSSLSHKSPLRFAVIAGTAALALTLSACSGASETSNDASGQVTTSTAIDDSSDTTRGSVADDDTSSAAAADGETKPVVASRPTTSIVEEPLLEEEPALDLENLPELEEPELSEPAEAIAAVAPEVENLTPEQEPLEALKEAVAKTATTAPPPDAKRDGYTRNDAGQLLVLDSAASLACADVEIGLTALDAGDVAGANTHISSAATRAGSSENASIAAWSASLATASGLEADSVSVLASFISVCAEGGYEI